MAFRPRGDSMVPKIRSGELCQGGVQGRSWQRSRDGVLDHGSSVKPSESVPAGVPHWTPHAPFAIRYPATSPSTFFSPCTARSDTTTVARRLCLHRAVTVRIVLRPEGEVAR